MLLQDSLVFPTIFELILAVSASVLTSLLALAYLRRIRLERPAIGTFNGRDIATLFVFIVGLPLLYIVLPQWLLTTFLTLTFVAAVSIGYRPLLNPTRLWPAIGLLVGVNFWLARTQLGTVLGWQVYWIENGVLVILAAVAVANLYVQGGMRLKHVAWFALILAVYDAIFTLKWPVTNRLAERFLGYPLNPSVGFRMGIYNASLGLGDLLVYALFLIAAYKAYGRLAARISMVIIVIFGAVVPSLAPLLFRELIDARTDLIVPAQSAFGPIAFLCYLWLKRRFGPERTTREFLASEDVPQSTPAAALTPPVPVPEPASA
ncbi:MAG: hypothetical protein QOF87_4132 [Pseudonocardiales bacterium]|nr:hypothetical protein [Pseudonocardiales bacterium]